MSYPIFQKGEKYTLKEIKKIIESGEDIESYLKGKFVYKGI